MVFILQFSLCLHELHRLVIILDYCLLLENVVLPFSKGLYNGVHLFFIGGVLTNDI
jgi:hypothetical protein